MEDSIYLDMPEYDNLQENQSFRNINLLDCLRETDGLDRLAVAYLYRLTERVYFER